MRADVSTVSVWLLLAAVVALAPCATASGAIKADNGPVLQAQAEAGGQSALVVFRFGFTLRESADLYLKNNPAPYNAAFREGWVTHLTLHGPSGPTDLGTLVRDHPLELGHLGLGQSHGIELAVTVPATDLRDPTTWNLSYVLAEHAATSGDDNGAALDPSVGVYLQLAVSPEAESQSLDPWWMPGWPEPADDDTGVRNADGHLVTRHPVAAAVAGTAIVATLLLAVFALTRKR